MDSIRRRILLKIADSQKVFVLFPLSNYSKEWDFIKEFNECTSIASKKYLLAFNSSVSTYTNDSGATMYFCEKSKSTTFTPISNGSTYTFTSGTTKRFAIGTSTTLTKYHNGVIAIYTGTATTISYGAASTTASSTDCTTLQQVYYTKSLTTLGTLAFAFNTSLTTPPSIQGGISTINDAFRGCSSISGVLDLSLSQLSRMNNGAFNGVGTATTNGLTDVIFPTVQCTANDGVFWGLNAVAENIIIPSNMTLTSNNLFGNAKGIKSVTIYPNISSYAFRQDSVSANQRTLKTVRIKSTCRSISSQAFLYCTAITDIYLEWTNSDIISYSSTAFPNVGAASNRTIHVPAGQTSNYNNKGWNSLGTIVEN